MNKAQYQFTPSYLEPGTGTVHEAITTLFPALDICPQYVKCRPDG